MQSFQIVKITITPDNHCFKKIGSKKGRPEFYKANHSITPSHRHP